MCVKLLQSCPTLSDPMYHCPPGSSVHGDSLGKNTGVGCHALLQGIFPTQGWNLGLPHCKQILYCLSHQGSPRILQLGSLSFFQGNLSDPEIEPGSPALQADSLPQSYQESSNLSQVNVLLYETKEPKRIKELITS